MIRRFFRAKPAAGPRGAVPPGQRIYAIGDIHGRLDLLDDLLARIRADVAERAAAEVTMIFLGDLIDRGPDSAGVVERLVDLHDANDTTRFLMGNHEEVFLHALSGDMKALRFFNRIGGRETILSYGVDSHAFAHADYPELLALLQAHVPDRHQRFLESFEDMIVIGDYAFVHAGVRPEAALADQTIGDLRWIRDAFLEFEGTLEKVVVHGHTISVAVEERRHRIGIDTGAYDSGTLTAMAFENDRRWVLQTG